MYTIKIEYPRNTKYRYQLYSNDKKVKYNRKLGFVCDNSFKSDEGIYHYKLVEYNIILSKFWYFVILLEILTSFIGGVATVNDYKNTRDTIKTIEFCIVPNKINQCITINIGSNGEIETISNVNSFDIVSNADEYKPLIRSRIKRYKVITFSFFGSFLFVVFSVLIVVMIAR